MTPHSSSRNGRGGLYRSHAAKPAAMLSEAAEAEQREYVEEGEDKQEQIDSYVLSKVERSQDRRHVVEGESVPLNPADLCQQRLDTRGEGDDCCTQAACQIELVADAEWGEGGRYFTKIREMARLAVQDVIGFAGRWR